MPFINAYPTQILIFVSNNGFIQKSSYKINKPDFVRMNIFHARNVYSYRQYHNYSFLKMNFLLFVFISSYYVIFLI